MALGTLAAAIAPSVISGGLNFLGSKLFGGKKNPTAPIQNFTPAGINAGGLSTSLSGGNLNLAASPERLGFVGNVANTFGDLAGQIAGLRGMVAPGVSQLRASRLAEIEGARSRAIGDLRENLQRRRVLGSSFGQDAITRAESEFAGAREKVAAESTLMELEASNNLINQQFNAQRQQFQTFLDELNLEAGIAAGLAGKATETMSANARLLSQLNVLEAQNAGKFFGQTFGPAFNAIGSSVGKSLGGFFNPSSGSLAGGLASAGALAGG